VDARADNRDAMEATFTMEMAQQAGLVGKSNWKKHPDDMMWARAVSRLCRRLFADCFAGASYVPEEVEATADELMDVPQFDSGELPMSEDEAELAGGLTEPGSAAPRGDNGTPAAGEPSTTASDVAPGSVSPLDQLIHTYGRHQVVAAYKTVFAGRPSDSPLSDDEVDLLADQLNTAGVGA
jgi:hypothetical protein